MAGRRAPRSALPTREQWAARTAAERPAGGRSPITVERIVRVALELVAQEGYEALTVRRVAAALGTGPASLYAHVRGKAELDDLLLDALLSGVEVPEPDPERWREQFAGVCAQVRDQLLGHPGIARVALGAVPHGLEPLRVAEGLLSLLLAGGVAPQAAAWASDAVFLYITAYCLDAAAAGGGTDGDGRVVDRAEITERLRMLPASRFPNTTRYAAQLTAGARHDRFDFSLGVLLRGLL